MLLSTLDGIETLLKANSKWHHFINLSGSDYPLLDPRWMDIVLKDCKGGNRTFIRMDNSNVTRKSALYMSNRYLINWEDGALAGKSSDDVKRYKYHNDGYWYMYNQPTFNINKGSAWVVLSREAAQFSLASSSSRWMLAFFSHTCSSFTPCCINLNISKNQLWRWTCILWIGMVWFNILKSSNTSLTRRKSRVRENFS